MANHTARDARWIAECPPDWYERDAAGAPAVPWDWTDTAKLDYGNRAVWRAQADAMAFWLTEHAVDGFRCDMAMLVPIEFWNETVRRLRALKPDLFMLAEAEERNLFDAPAFDACYAWEMHHLMCDVAQGKVRLTALRDYIYADRDRYPSSAMRLAFTSNHDENSWSGSEFARLGAAREIMALFTFVVPRGLPLVYTGQEVGYDHSFAFFDRDPIPAERYRADDTTEFYRRLAALRHANPALAAGERGGEPVEIRNNAEDCLMTLVREVEGNRVVAIMNLSPHVHPRRLSYGHLCRQLHRCDERRGVRPSPMGGGGYGAVELPRTRAVSAVPDGCGRFACCRRLFSGAVIRSGRVCRAICVCGSFLQVFSYVCNLDETFDSLLSSAARRLDGRGGHLPCGADPRRAARRPTAVRLESRRDPVAPRRGAHRFVVRSVARTRPSRRWRSWRWTTSPRTTSSRSPSSCSARGAWGAPTSTTASASCS